MDRYSKIPTVLISADLDTLNQFNYNKGGDCISITTGSNVEVFIFTN